MDRRKILALATGAALGLTLACNPAKLISPLTGTNGTGTGTNGTTNYNTATGSMKATIDGTSWVANYQTRVVLSSGALSITGISYNGDLGAQREVTMAIINVGSGGTFTLSTPGDGHGGNAIAALGGSKQWYTSQTGGSGSVTITTINATHVVGSFFFVGIGGTAGLANTTVTSGTFDIPF